MFEYFLYYLVGVACFTIWGLPSIIASKRRIQNENLLGAIHLASLVPIFGMLVYLDLKLTFETYYLICLSSVASMVAVSWLAMLSVSILGKRAK